MQEKTSYRCCSAQELKSPNDPSENAILNKFLTFWGNYEKIEFNLSIFHIELEMC